MDRNPHVFKVLDDFHTFICSLAERGLHEQYPTHAAFVAAAVKLWLEVEGRADP
jgi:hypothetical protein